jgi:hypothetical protein
MDSNDIKACPSARHDGKDNTIHINDIHVNAE